jgi:flagella basal body P-ring formation protein FlgA
MASFTNSWLLQTLSVMTEAWRQHFTLIRPAAARPSTASFQSFAVTLQSGAERQWLRILRIGFGAALITIGSAAAASASLSSTNPPSPSASPKTTAEIATKVTALLPEGTRLRSVDLGCQPPAGAVLKEVAPGITQLNSRGFVVEFQTGDRTVTCSATLEAERLILVAARGIAPGEMLSAADFEPSWTDAFGGSTTALSSLPGAGPFVATTAIAAGQPLLAVEITRPLAIHPGDLVTVVIKNGPVTVRTLLEARSAAAIGDSASLINPESGMPVAVTVTGEKTAELVIQ